MSFHALRILQTYYKQIRISLNVLKSLYIKFCVRSDLIKIKINFLESHYEIPEVEHVAGTFLPLNPFVEWKILITFIVSQLHV